MPSAFILILLLDIRTNCVGITEINNLDMIRRLFVTIQFFLPFLNLISNLKPIKVISDRSLVNNEPVYY